MQHTIEGCRYFRDLLKCRREEDQESERRERKSPVELIFFLRKPYWRSIILKDLKSFELLTRNFRKNKVEEIEQ